MIFKNKLIVYQFPSIVTTKYIVMLSSFSDPFSSISRGFVHDRMGHALEPFSLSSQPFAQSLIPASAQANVSAEATDFTYREGSHNSVSGGWKPTSPPSTLSNGVGFTSEDYYRSYNLSTRLSQIRSQADKAELVIIEVINSWNKLLETLENHHRLSASTPPAEDVSL